MKKIFIFLSSIFTIGLLFLTFVYLQKNINKKPVLLDKNTTQSPTTPLLKKEAALFLFPQNISTASGQPLNFEIKLQAKDLTLATVNLRLKINYQDNSPLKIISPKIKPNPVLVNNGWIYTFNKIYYEEKNNVIIDLLLANFTPAGYKISDEITLGTVSLETKSKNSKTAIIFDPEQTRIRTKDNKLVNLEINNTSYTIY